MVRENLIKVQQKIDEACERSGRDPKEVTLIAVSKTKPIEMIEEAIDAGKTQFGENKAQEMKEKYDIIGDVRGIGGMLGVEFVKDKESKEPNPEFVSKLVQTALQKGLLLENAGSSSNVVRFLAPLCMTEEQMEAGLKIFEESILANL